MDKLHAIWAGLADDSRKHFVVGWVVAVFLVAVVLLALWEPWAAVLLGGLCSLGFVEWYQRKRGNGKAELKDLAFGMVGVCVMSIATALVL